MKPGPGDTKAFMLIDGEELVQLKRFTIDMCEAYGLDRKVERYVGKKPIGFYSWDLDCLSAVIDNALNNRNEYPNKSAPEYLALDNLYTRIQDAYKDTSRN
jgi:hypothetical protein